MHIQVELKSEKYAALCNEYWERHKRGQFENSIEELAKRHGISRTREVTDIIRENCTAFILWQCRSCGAEFRYDIKTRTDIFRLEPVVKRAMCDPCREKHNAEVQELYKKLFPQQANNDAANVTAEDIGQSTAALFVEAGHRKHYIRFESLTECSTRLFPQAEEGSLVLCEVIIKGTARRDDLMEIDATPAVDLCAR